MGRKEGGSREAEATTNGLTTAWKRTSELKTSGTNILPLPLGFTRHLIPDHRQSPTKQQWATGTTTNAGGQDQDQEAQSEEIEGKARRRSASTDTVIGTLVLVLALGTDVARLHQGRAGIAPTPAPHTGARRNGAQDPALARGVSRFPHPTVGAGGRRTRGKNVIIEIARSEGVAVVAGAEAGAEAGTGIGKRRSIRKTRRYVLACRRR